LNFAFLDAWHRFLPRDGGHVVVIRGGGGRDDLLRAVRRVLEEEGVPVVETADLDDVERRLAVSGDHVVLHAPPPGAAVDLPRSTSLVLTVTGLSDVGCAPGPAATGAEPVPAAWLTPGESGPVWSWDGVLAYLADAAPTVPHAAALLEMEACDDSPGLFDCVGRIMSDLGIPLVLLGDAAGDARGLRTAYALRPGDAP